MERRQTSETHQSAGCQDNSLPTYAYSLYSQVQEPKKHLIKVILGCETTTNLNPFIFLSS